MKCLNCGSLDVSKKGFRKNKHGTKQKYQCFDCKKWFIEDDGFKKMRFEPDVIARAVHQHEDGFSLSKVQNHLWQHDGVKVTRWTISQWKKKYSLFFGSNTSKF
jgi:hypothetical protein